MIEGNMWRWLALIIVIVLVELISTSLANSLYSIVRVEGGEAYLLLRDQTARLIPDNGSIQALHHDPGHLPSIHRNTLFTQYKLGHALPSLVRRDNSPDEIIRIEIVRSLEIQGTLLHNVTDVGAYINPGVIFWKGRFLVMAGLGWTLPGMNDGIIADELLYYRWNDFPHLSPPKQSNTVDWSKKMKKIEPPAIWGQDPRLLVYHDEDGKEVLHVSYTFRFVQPLRMGRALISLNPSNHTLQIKACTSVLSYNSPHPHKNWMPFIYPEDGNKQRETIYYIVSINPMIVVKAKKQETIFQQDLQVETVSQQETSLNLNWHYGELRGGTNALYLSQYGVYLAFFHSSRILPGNSMKTYFLGAMTFAGQPPFALLAHSNLPILLERFYVGPWNPLKNRRIDYVMFPSTLSFHPDNQSRLILSFGHQDIHGYLATLEIKPLLDSLVSMK
eukprot:gene3132-3430_t